MIQWICDHEFKIAFALMALGLVAFHAWLLLVAMRALLLSRHWRHGQRANDGREESTVVELREEVRNLAAKLKDSEARYDMMERACRSLQEEVNSPRIARLVEGCKERDARIAELEQQIKDREGDR